MIQVATQSGLLIAAAVAVAAGLLVVGSLTLGGVIYHFIRHRHSQPIQADLRREIVKRVNWNDPEWQSWVDDLDRFERRVLRRLLDRQLPKVSGTYRDSLQSLGVALGLDEWAMGRLNSKNELTRLDALHWIALLNAPVDDKRLLGSGGSVRERAAVARVLYERDGVEAARTGTAYLLTAGDGQSLSGYGVHILYRFNKENPTALIEALDDWERWDRTLVVQVLAVLRACDPGPPDAVIRRLRPCLDADAAAIRAAAVQALEPYTDVVDVGEHVEVADLISDPSTRVRSAVYHQLSTVDDPAAIETLANSAIDEEDAVVRYVGTSELAEYFQHRKETPEAVRPHLDWFEQTGDCWQLDWRSSWELDSEMTEPPEVEG